MRDDSVTIGTRCACCGQGFRAQGRRRFCSAACRQHAYRKRRQTALPAPPQAATAAQTIYECPACATRLLGEQRCPDCNLFCTRLGPGGPCPHCDQPVTLADLN